MRHSPRELLKVGKSDRGEQKSIPILYADRGDQLTRFLVGDSPLKYSKIRTIFRCARWAEYGLGRKEESVIFSELTGTMKFDKTRAVEEQIETLVNTDVM